jgi:hypothetical protein
MKRRPLTCGPNSPEDESIKQPLNDPDNDVILSPTLIASHQTQLKNSVAKESNVYVADEAETNSGYDTLSSSSPQHSAGDLDDNFDSDEIARLSSSASSRSSTSSFPASVIIHPMDDSKSLISPDLPQIDGRDASKGGSARYMAKFREIHAPFRHPSSVRAIQMDTEDEDEDFDTTSRCRRGAHCHRDPGISRSIESTPLRRPGYYSSDGTPKKLTAKKEYPLVLLHCHLLPPTLSLSASLGIPNQHVLKEILPLRYWRRWKLLEENIVGSGVLRERGVLIPHPQEMYDALEERLLESLELEQPRLQNGHFISKDENGPSRDGDADLDADDDKHECPDCGSKVADGGINRKWEIKVYAANGLMKSGAWAAAWREMEKVDVEVSLWLPPDIRTALERRMAEESTPSFETEVRRPNAVSQRDKSKDELQLCQDQIDGLSDAIQADNQSCATQNQAITPQERDPAPCAACDNEIGNEVELQTLVIDYLRVLARDKRNVAIAILSSLLLLFAIGGAQLRTPENKSVAQEILEFAEPPSMTITQYSTVSSISISTTTETLILQGHPTRSVTTINSRPKETSKQLLMQHPKTTTQAMALSIPELKSGQNQAIYAPYEQCPRQNGGSPDSAELQRIDYVII